MQIALASSALAANHNKRQLLRTPPLLINQSRCRALFGPNVGATAFRKVGVRHNTLGHVRRVYMRVLFSRFWGAYECVVVRAC